MSEKIVKFCAEECGRQKSGEMSVFHMWQAYQFAMEAQSVGEEPGLPPNVSLIIRLGRLVEPLINQNGPRKIPVIFASGGHATNWQDILPALVNLCHHGIPKDDPDEYYRSFEKIHPFQDGNGRVGAILYNWHRLDAPMTPPKFW